MSVKSDCELAAFGVLGCVVFFALPIKPGCGSSERIAYEVRLQGLSSGKLRTALESQSQTVKNKKRAPASVRQLIHRAQGDIPRLTDALRSQGYYEGAVSVDVTAESTPAIVRFDVTPGPLYHIGPWSIVFEGIEAGQTPPTPTLPTRQNRPAVAESILVAEQACLQQLRNNGYPFCRTTGRQVTLEPKDKTVHLTTLIAPGAPAQFGAVHVEGVTHVDTSYVRKRVTWAPGDPFEQRVLRDLEKSLLRCGLFSSARVETGDTLDPNGLLPIEIKVSERKHRTVRVGGSYVSDDPGVGAQFSWEHRNLFGQGHRLGAELAGSQIESRQSTRYVYPDLWKPNQDLHVDVDLKRQFPDAFDSESLRTAATLQCRMPRWHTRIWAGMAQDISTVEQFNTHHRYRFIELPLGWDWDRRNDPLDAKQGWRFLAQTTPTLDARSDLRFGKHFGEARYFLPLDELASTVLASRVGLGVITGASLMEVPADKRFYAGGAGSVRGYGYQQIGARVNSTPVGGLSVVETSFEVRHSWDAKIGTVLFLDGGMVLPERFGRGSNESMRWGAGAGLRYALGFAPLRIDLAFPLNPQHDDRKVQFYVSIGQAF